MQRLAPPTLSPCVSLWPPPPARRSNRAYRPGPRPLCPESRRPPRPPTCARRHLSRPAYASIPARRRSAACRVPRTPGSGWRRRSTARPRHGTGRRVRPGIHVADGTATPIRNAGDETRPASRSAGRSTVGPGPAPGGSRTSNTTGSDSAGRSPGSDRSVMIAHGCALPDGTRHGIAAPVNRQQARRISSQSPGRSPDRRTFPPPR